MKEALRAVLRAVGKRETKVAAVFAFTPEGAQAAVEYVRRGAPGVPVWLFLQGRALPATTALCERVHLGGSSLALLIQAQRTLWPYWVALGVTTWTGQHGRWPLKLAPFLIPPFRALVLNEHGDFLPGTPLNILRHCARGLLDALHSAGNRARDLALAYCLLMVSLVLRAGAILPGPLFYRLFDRFRGSEPLRIAPAANSGEGVVRFCQKGTHWSPAKLAQLLLSSNARWLFWREYEDSPEAIDDMLPLFADQRTFAVSRQTNFRGWKPMPFPTAPFRTLQPCEASQVMAPLSTSILVDRRKMLALGIPRSVFAGSAWLILFWKAAAAGWRSYSVGQAGTLCEQPNLPMQETGFLLRFLFSRKLRRIGPREPGLSRGSIAFVPARFRCAPESERLKVLLVSPFLPFPLSHGGAVRIWNLCRSLAGRVDFILIAIREKQDIADYDKLHEIFREVWVVDKDELRSTDERLPEQVRHHQSRSLRALIPELARRWKPDLLQIEYTHMAHLRDAAPEVPAILVEHDLTFSLYRQLAEKKEAVPAAGPEYHRWLEFERHWLSAYDAVWTVSEEDRQAAIRESGRPAGRTFAIANGVDIERFVPRDEPAPAPEIFYVGSFRHLPNIIGFEKLREEVMPRVWSSFPQARLRVVAGPQHEEFWNRFTHQPVSPVFDDRVEIHGFVEDLRPLYARASVVVVPLEVSAGTNIKVLEAMACGKAIVTTPIGCEGLGLRDRHDVFIDHDWPAFARSVAGLLSDAARRSHIAAQARRTAEERFSWTAIAHSAYESYLTLVGEPRPALTSEPVRRV